MNLARVDCPDCLPKPTGVITVYSEGASVLMTTTSREPTITGGPWRTVPETKTYDSETIKVSVIHCTCRRCKATGHISGAELDDAVNRATSRGWRDPIRLHFHKDE